MKTINYYAFAKRLDGKIGQLFVTRIDGKFARQVWTDVVYRTVSEAVRDMEFLNCRKGA